MRNFTYFSLLLLLFTGSCIKKEEDCTINAHKAPCYIAFFGFTPADVDTIVRLRYEQGSGFTRLLATDTLIVASPWSAPDGDIFGSSSRTHMGTLDANADYEVTIPAMSRTFRISNLTYQSDTVYHYTTKDGCGSFGVNTAYPKSAIVGTRYTTTSTLSFNDSKWLLLSN